MPTYYMDLYKGDDSKDGSSWANAWKTFTNGPTAARITAGDSILIAKTKDPSYVCQGTVLSDTDNYVALGSGVTLDIERCESVWTASANVTPSTESYYKIEGSYSAEFNVLSGFSTGKIAYKALASGLDLTNFYAINFAINKSSTGVDVGKMQLKLCSDVAGDTPVYSFDIANPLSTNRWHYFVKDNGGNALISGGNIQSIALYADSEDPGSGTFRIDNIFASKDPNDPTCIDFNTMVAFEASDARQVKQWGTLLNIALNQLETIGPNGDAPGEGRGLYPYGTGTYSLYRRTATPYPDITTYSAFLEILPEGGTAAGGYIKFRGGINTTNDAQDGFTCILGAGLMTGKYLYASNRDYIQLESFIFGRFYYGLNVTYSAYWNLYDIQLADSYYAFYHSASHNEYFTFNNFVFHNNNIAFNTGSDAFAGLELLGSGILSNNNYGLSAAAGITLIASGEISMENNYYTAIKATFWGGVDQNLLYGCTFNKNGSIFDCGSAMTAKNCSFDVTDASTSSWFTDWLEDSRFIDCTFRASMATTIPTARKFTRSKMHFKNCTGYQEYSSGPTLVPSGTTVGTTYRYYPQDSVRQVASGMALQVTLNSEGTQSYSMTEDNPVQIPIAEVACKGTGQVTVSAYVKFSYATGRFGAKLICHGGQIAGVDGDVSDTKVDNTDWEQLTIQFTPTEEGIVRIFVECWILTTTAKAPIYIDTVSVSQA